MSKIGTVNLQNCKIGTSVVSKVLIGTSVYWSNVPKAMPPFNLNDWYVSGGSQGSYGLTIQNNKLVQSLTAWTWNWNQCTITSNELRSARHITVNCIVSSNTGNFGETIRIIVEVKNGNTWAEATRANVGYGSNNITLNVPSGYKTMRIKVTMEGYGGEGSYGDNLNASITFNNINFS